MPSPIKALLLSTLVAAVSADLQCSFKHPARPWSANTTISFPGGCDFTNATIRWNAYEGPGYAVAVSAGTAADVAQAVQIARAHNASLLATGGRHSSSTTLNDVDNGVAIDLQRLDTVQVDAQNALLTIGGGTRFGAIVEPVYKAGFEMPVGSCACPGMVGASIGGGVGRFQGIDGLLIDRIVSVNIVTADGKMNTASATENPDLYWAVRGAGQNFGIITSATFSLPSQTNGGQVFSADFVFAAEKNASYYDLIQGLKGTMPAELGTVTIAEYNTTTKSPQLLVNWLYIGPEAQGRQLVQPLVALGPISTTQQMLAYNEIYPNALGGLGDSLCGNDVVSEVGYGINFANLSSSTFQTVFQKLSDFYIQHPDGVNSSIEMEVFAPQAVEKVPWNATAYPWRNSLGYSLIAFQWNSTATQKAGEALAEEIRADYAATSGLDGVRVYVSYGHGNEKPEQLWGKNYPRLQRIKAKWDPSNVFRFFHTITPA